MSKYRISHPTEESPCLVRPSKWTTTTTWQIYSQNKDQRTENKIGLVSHLITFSNYYHKALKSCPKSNKLPNMVTLLKTDLVILFQFDWKVKRMLNRFYLRRLIWVKLLKWEIELRDCQMSKFGNFLGPKSDKINMLLSSVLT